MSRVLFVSMTPSAAIAACEKHSAAVSTTELLPSGGTRLVLKSADATDMMAKVLGKYVISGHVERHALTGRRAAPGNPADLRFS